MCGRIHCIFATCDKFCRLLCFSICILCYSGLRFIPGGRQKFLLPLGSCCASSREEIFNRQLSAGSAMVTGRILECVICIPFREEPAVDSQSQRGSMSLRQVGIWDKSAASQWSLNEWSQNLKITTHFTNLYQEKNLEFLFSFFFLLLFALLRLWWFCWCCFTNILLSLGGSWVCMLKAFQFLVEAPHRRGPMNVYFKALDNLSPARTVLFRTPYIRTLKNPTFWHNGCERSVHWEKSSDYKS